MELLNNADYACCPDETIVKHKREWEIISIVSNLENVIFTSSNATKKYVLTHKIYVTYDRLVIYFNVLR